MITKRCWNCKRELKTIRSPRTGAEYCEHCGAATNGMGWVAVMNRMMEAGRTAAAGDVLKGGKQRKDPDKSRKPV
jgi:ribosomal protein L37AE/L43A